MFFENKRHLAYEEEQYVTRENGSQEIIVASQLEQRDFSKFYLLAYRPFSASQGSLEGAGCLCYYETQLVRVQLGRPSVIQTLSAEGKCFSKIGYICKKISFINPHEDVCVANTTDYIIPHSRIHAFDELSECADGGGCYDAISIMGQHGAWKLKNLLQTEAGAYAVSPFVRSNHASFSHHLILSTTATYCEAVEEEAKNIAYLLQLALGKLSLPVCRIVRNGAQLLEIVPLNSPNSIPGFWSPLGMSWDGERGRIKQFIENALPCMSKRGADGSLCLRSVLSTYATMNMRHVHVEHRLLFSFLLLDTLYNLFVPMVQEHQERSATAQHQTLSALEKDLAAVFRQHQIGGAEKSAKMVVNELQKRGRGRGKVLSYEQRVRQLFELFDCVPPMAEDLAKRNEIMHEGALNELDSGEKLRIMTGMLNAVTALLFKMFRYEGKVDFLPEHAWKVVPKSNQ